LSLIFFQNLSISALKVLAIATVFSHPLRGSLLSQLYFDAYRDQSFVFFALILTNSNVGYYAT